MYMETSRTDPGRQDVDVDHRRAVGFHIPIAPSSVVRETLEHNALDISGNEGQERAPKNRLQAHTARANAEAHCRTRSCVNVHRTPSNIRCSTVGLCVVVLTLLGRHIETRLRRLQIVRGTRVVLHNIRGLVAFCRCHTRAAGFRMSVWREGRIEV